jgi:hypothetical protein
MSTVDWAFPTKIAGEVECCKVGFRKRQNREERTWYRRRVLVLHNPGSKDKPGTRSFARWLYYFKVRRHIYGRRYVQGFWFTAKWCHSPQCRFGWLPLLHQILIVYRYFKLACFNAIEWHYILRQGISQLGRTSREISGPRSRGRSAHRDPDPLTEGLGYWEYARTICNTLRLGLLMLLVRRRGFLIIFGSQLHRSQTVKIWSSWCSIRITDNSQRVLHAIKTVPWSLFVLQSNCLASYYAVHSPRIPRSSMQRCFRCPCTPWW